MKKWCVRFLAGILLAFLLALPVAAQAGDEEGQAAEPWIEVPQVVQELLEQAPVSAEEFATWTPEEIGRWLWNQARQEWEAPLRLLLRLLAFCLLGAAITAFSPTNEWADCLENVLVLGAFLLVGEALVENIARVSESVLAGQTYLVGFVPVFAGVLVSCGQPGTAAVYSSLFLAVANLSAQLICVLALPMLRVYLAMNTAASLCLVDGLQRLCGLLEKGVRWLLRGLAAVFALVLGLQTTLAQASDSLALKAGRIVSSAIPVVGGTASAAMDSVLAALRVLKGALGFAAIAVLLVTFVPLLLRCVTYTAVLVLGAIAAKACGLGRTSGMLDGLASGFRLCISFICFFFLLVVLSTALMILMGGG